ncbi:MAG: hypothetical protein Q9M31_08850 [Mariprofundus sp.]|nr:hypothetical protein [Mariprofundus sp.]
MIKYSRFSLTSILLILLSLSACMATDNPVPANQLTNLQGVWQQIDGTARVQFYADESVKLSMSDENPPLRLLSTLEVIKDEQIGFGVGDRWNGPVHTILSKDGKNLELIFPGDPDRTLNFLPANSAQ